MTPATWRLAGDRPGRLWSVPIVPADLAEQRKRHESIPYWPRRPGRCRGRGDSGDDGFGGSGDGHLAPPADCTVTNPDLHTATMTCTNRPAGQKWQLQRNCFGVWLDSYATGDVVTGNGSSTAVCPLRTKADLDGPMFASPPLTDGPYSPI